MMHWYHLDSAIEMTSRSPPWDSLCRRVSSEKGFSVVQDSDSRHAKAIQRRNVAILSLLGGINNWCASGIEHKVASDQDYVASSCATQVQNQISKLGL